MEIQRWTVGAATITRVVEAETPGIPPELFFPEATAERRAGATTWLVPDFAAADGTITFAVQAFVRRRRLAPDHRRPVRRQRQDARLSVLGPPDYPFWERFEAAGFDAASVDQVVHTHLHADHIGWDTRKVDDVWEPTFTNARYLYDERELAHRHASDDPGRRPRLRRVDRARSSPPASPTWSTSTPTSATACASSRSIGPHAGSRLAVDRVRGRHRASSPATSSTTRSSAPSPTWPRSPTATSTPPARPATACSPLGRRRATPSSSAPTSPPPPPAASSPTATPSASAPSAERRRAASGGRRAAGHEPDGSAPSTGPPIPGAIPRTRRVPSTQRAPTNPTGSQHPPGAPPDGR